MNIDNNNEVNTKGSRSYVVTLLLSLFLGGFGIHRFYTGYTVIGVIQLLTAGGFGLWSLVDLVSIALNTFKDADGEELNDPNAGCGLIVLVFVIISFVIGGISSVLSTFSMFK